MDKDEVEYITVRASKPSLGLFKDERGVKLKLLNGKTDSAFILKLFYRTTFYPYQGSIEFMTLFYPGEISLKSLHDESCLSAAMKNMEWVIIALEIITLKGNADDDGLLSLMPFCGLTEFRWMISLSGACREMRWGWQGQPKASSSMCLGASHSHI